MMEVLMGDDQSMETQQNNCDIGIIGDTQSGKTLYLSSLPRYSKDLNVVLVGQDQKSNDWIYSRTKELKDGKLPGATLTLDANILTFSLVFNEVKENTIRRVNIKTGDVPGITFDNPNEELIKYLLHCRGFVILINTNGESTQFDTIKNTLTQIINKSNSSNVLTHRISVCLSQYDNPKFLKSAKVQFAPENSIETPLMSEKNSFDALKNLFVSHSKKIGLDFIKYLSSYWAQEGINYFSISSLGFYVYPNEPRVDKDHCTNIIHVGKDGKKVLRNGFADYKPVHLLKPITWILSTTQNKVNIIS